MREVAGLQDVHANQFIVLFGPISIFLDELFRIIWNVGFYIPGILAWLSVQPVLIEEERRLKLKRRKSFSYKHQLPMTE